MRDNRDIIKYILYTPQDIAQAEPWQAQISRQFKRIMDWMPGGFFIYRAQAGEELLYANEAMLRIFGCDTMEELRTLTGNSFRGIVHPEDLDAVEESIREQIIASRYDLDYVEYRIIRKDGQIRWLDDYGHFIRSEAGDVFCVFVSDTTEKRMTQLRRDLKQREVLELALRQATSAVAAKNAFLASVSHDMHTPMNAILGFTALTRKNLGDPDRVLGCLDMIEEAGGELLRQVDGVLESARMEGGRIQLSESDGSLSELAYRVAESFQTQAGEKKLSLSVELTALEHPNVRMDREKVEEVLGLFLDNAVKYTPMGGAARLEVRELDSANRGYGRYRMTVSDNGPGIAPDFLGRVFAPFERENNTTVSGVPGTGLGLSIAKSLAEMMGGTVEVESTQGQGSRFSLVLTLPLAGKRDGEEGKARAMLSARPEIPGKVLLVEDNELNMELTRELMEGEGFRVDAAWNGQEAVDRVKDSAPGEYAIILMDLQMPVMDGCSAARAIRALPDPGLAGIPIVALSANAYEEDRRRTSESGMNAHVSKPVRVPELLRVMEELLRKT